MFDPRPHTSARTSPPARAARGGEDGVVAVILAIMLLALAGMGALAIDLGKAFNLETQMQKAADAAALACAGRLDFKLNTLQEYATQAAAGGFAEPGWALARNTQNFSNDGEPNVLSPTSTVVEFFDHKPGPGSTPVDPNLPASANANFCRVTVEARQVGFSFAGLIGAPSSAAVSAKAVATTDFLACQHPLLMMCSFNLPPLGIPVDFTNTGVANNLAGRGMVLRPANTGGSGTDFGILMPVAKNPTASDVRDAAGRDSPMEECTRVGAPAFRRTGAAASVAQGINMRFGVPVASADPHYAPAERTWDFPRDTGTPYVTGGFTGAGHYVVGSGVWDVAGYMAARHPGVSVSQVTRLDGSPCTTATVNGKTNCSRFEVYLWEIGGLTPGAPSPDRRVITLPVMTNCTAANPTPTTWIEVFLTEQVGPSTGHNTGHVANEIHVEFIGPAYVDKIGPADRFGQGVMRRFVRLVD